MTPIPQKLIQALRSSSHIVALTGAGISAESGVPTFREAQTGLWAQYDPQELATPQAFQRNPKLVWEWYAWRRELVTTAVPNPGHLALVQMERLAPRFTLITQNVDSLHQRAGSTAVIELHGNLSRIKCSRDHRIVTGWETQTAVPPHCPDCEAHLRPDVVWFGENMPEQPMANALAAAADATVFLAIGTSAIVQPAASLPMMAMENAAVTVEINPKETPLTRYIDHPLTGPAGEVLPALIKAVWPDVIE